MAWEAGGGETPLWVRRGSDTRPEASEALEDSQQPAASYCRKVGSAEALSVPGRCGSQRIAVDLAEAGEVAPSREAADPTWEAVGC